MQFLNYFLASLISFFGLAIGIFLIMIAPEEQKPLGKYFIKLRKLLLLLIFVFVIFYYTGKSSGFSVPRKFLIFVGFKNPFYISLLLACFISILFIEYKTNDFFKKIMMSYLVFGILFFLSFQNKNLFVLESSLILLYGMPAASLIYNKKNHYKVISYNLFFVILANLLYIITTSRFLF